MVSLFTSVLSILPTSHSNWSKIIPPFIKQETGSFQELHFGISCKYLKYVNGKQQTRIIIKYSAVPELHPSSSSSSRIIIKYSAIECGKVKPTNKKVALSEKCSCCFIYIIKENNYTDRLCNITYVGISENFLNYVKANTFSASGTIFDSYLIFVFFFTFWQSLFLYVLGRFV